MTIIGVLLNGCVATFPQWFYSGFAKEKEQPPNTYLSIASQQPRRESTYASIASIGPHTVYKSPGAGIGVLIMPSYDEIPEQKVSTKMPSTMTLYEEPPSHQGSAESELTGFVRTPSFGLSGLDEETNDYASVVKALSGQTTQKVGEDEPLYDVFVKELEHHARSCHADHVDLYVTDAGVAEFDGVELYTNSSVVERLLTSDGYINVIQSSIGTENNEVEIYGTDCGADSVTQTSHSRNPPSMQQPRRSISQADSVYNASTPPSWFARMMSSEDAEKVLKGCPEGCYLVRYQLAEKTPTATGRRWSGEIARSRQYWLSVRTNDATSHLEFAQRKVYENHLPFYTLQGDNITQRSPEFATIVDLVHHYAKRSLNTLGIDVCLSTPFRDLGKDPAGGYSTIVVGKSNRQSHPENNYLTVFGKDRYQGADAESGSGHGFRGEGNSNLDCFETGSQADQGSYNKSHDEYLAVQSNSVRRSVSDVFVAGEAANEQLQRPSLATSDTESTGGYGFAGGSDSDVADSEVPTAKDSRVHRSVSEQIQQLPSLVSVAESTDVYGFEADANSTGSVNDENLGTHDRSGSKRAPNRPTLLPDTEHTGGYGFGTDSDQDDFASQTPSGNGTETDTESVAMGFEDDDVEFAFDSEDSEPELGTDGITRHPSISSVHYYPGV